MSTYDEYNKEWILSCFTEESQKYLKSFYHLEGSVVIPGDDDHDYHLLMFVGKQKKEDMWGFGFISLGEVNSESYQPIDLVSQVLLPYFTDGTWENAGLGEVGFWHNQIRTKEFAYNLADLNAYYYAKWDLSDKCFDHDHTWAVINKPQRTRRAKAA